MGIDLNCKDLCTLFASSCGAHSGIKNAKPSPIEQLCVHKRLDKSLLRLDSYWQDPGAKLAAATKAFFPRELY